MRRVGLSILGGVLSVSFVAGVVLAARVQEPAKAKSLKFSVVKRYADCTVPNDTTTGLPSPACHPAVETDTTCGFDAAAGGKGSLSATITGTPDIKIKAKLKGLNAGCETRQLCLDATIKQTTDGCASSDPNGCTTVTIDFGPTLAAFPAFFCCTVTGGQCSINSKLNDTGLVPGGLTAGDNINIQISDCGMRRTTGPGAPLDSFSCGILVP